MSLRLRLSLILGSAFAIIWAVAAAWMLRDLDIQMSASLDQRLAASARMVAGLVEQLPRPLAGAGQDALIRADQSTIPDGMACQITSLRGEILARSHNQQPGNLDAATTTGFHDLEVDGDRWRSFTLVLGDVRITTADRLVERAELNHSVLLAASLPVIFALLGMLSLLWLGVGKGLAPLSRMRDALQRRSPDSLEPLQVRALPSELRPLLDTQNHLLLRIGRAIERERRLTGDAAHELRSPLTAIKTHLQVARMTDGVAHEQALDHAEQGTERLQRTLEQLLLLARVEGSLSFEDGQRACAEQVARQAIHDVAPAGRERIELHLAPALSGQHLNVPVALAVAALRNLLDNALRHGPELSPVLLAVAVEEGMAWFEVRDHGPGVAPKDLASLTQRFWRSGQGAGSGLGLAIVQAIVERCGCELAFDNRADGLRVRVGMPLV